MRVQWLLLQWQQPLSLLLLRCRLAPPECDWLALKNDGYSARELKIAGCSWAALLALEYDLPSLRAAGYDAAAFRAAGFSWTEMNTAGFTAREIRLRFCICQVCGIRRRFSRVSVRF